MSKMPNPVVPVAVVSGLIYALICSVVDIHGLWWLVMFMSLPIVLYASAFLITLFMPSLFFPEGLPEEKEEKPEHSANAGHMVILSQGPSIGVFGGEPIYDFVIAQCADGKTRRYDFKAICDQEPSEAPAARWFLSNDRLYVCNEP